MGYDQQHQYNGNHRNGGHNDGYKRRRDDQGDHGHKRNRNSDHVRNHYNARPELGISGREQSRIIALRDFNNWTKSALIVNWVGENENCFDMCCGKGGDLLKWAYVNAGFLFACDIADQSIVDAKQRSLNMRNRPFRAQFECADLSKVRIADSILPRARETNELIVFDCVSCQFGLHYGFESEDSCDMFFQNASDRLKNGGHFFGTLPNAVRLVKLLRDAQRANPDCLSYGNDLYKIEFKADPSSHGEFGSAYDFTLTSAVEKCTEYLVHPAVLRAVGEKFGLELVLYQGFHEFFEKETKDAESHANKLLNRMVFRNRNRVPEDDWKIAGLYSVFCFRKKTDKFYAPQPAPQPAREPAPEQPYASPEPEEDAPW